MSYIGLVKACVSFQYLKCPEPRQEGLFLVELRPLNCGRTADPTLAIP